VVVGIQSSADSIVQTVIEEEMTQGGNGSYVSTGCCFVKCCRLRISRSP